MVEVQPHSFDVTWSSNTHRPARAFGPIFEFTVVDMLKPAVNSRSGVPKLDKVVGNAALLEPWVVLLVVVQDLLHLVMLCHGRKMISDLNFSKLLGPFES